MSNLPSLIGTKAQARWADDIRSDKLVDLRILQTEIPDIFEYWDLITQAQYVVRHALHQQAASWWIDNRHVDFDENWIIDQILSRYGMKTRPNLDEVVLDKRIVELMQG